MDIGFDKETRSSFTGWARPVDLFGLFGLDHGANGVRMERRSRHVQFWPDDYSVSLQLTGNCVASQDDNFSEALPGDLTLFDSTRPAWRVDDGRIFTFRLPRKLVVSCLGYEPQGGLLSRDTLAGRLVSQIVGEVIKGEPSAPAPDETYMQMAVYDLICAAFARPGRDLRSGSPHTEKLFEQVCCIIRDTIADPDLSPSKVAAEAGISLRYLQKLFTPKGMTCGHFIHALRLDHAARLLHRRARSGAKLPLSEIAFAAGFRDYNFFARKFRERFGCVPSAYSAPEQK
jgi:AraC family transcriptional regulator, positive regulator of tynA and feaB